MLYARVAVFFALFIAGIYCRLPLSNKQYLYYKPVVDPATTRIEQKFTGDVHILRVATGSSPDVLKSLRVTSAIHQCASLANVDLEFFDYNFYLFGFPRLLIRADCLRAGPAPAPVTKPEAPEA
jgi:hypothetical protein